MNIDEEIENIFDSLRKVLFYAGHGKYNDVMSFEDVQSIKNKLEKILGVEEEYKVAKTMDDKQAILKRLEPYTSFSIRDFIDLKINKV